MKRDANPGWRRLKSSPFHRIGDTYGHFFNPDHFLGRSAFDDSWLAAPANLKKNEETYELEVALPGFSKEDVSVSLQNDMIRVKAERNGEYKDQYLAREMHFDTITRLFPIDEGVDREKISAHFENGLLRIFLPCDGKEHEARSRRVVVE